MSFIYNLSAIWNNVATTFNGIMIDVSNGSGGSPAADTASRLLNLKNNGTSVFSVDINGNIITPAGIINSFLGQTSTFNTTINVSTDWNGRFLVLGGNAYYPLVFGAASSYPDGYRLYVYNANVANAVFVTLPGYTSYRHWPGQWNMVFTQGGAWFKTPLVRYKIGTNPTFYINPAGNDNYDGRTTGTAFASIEQTLVMLLNEIDTDPDSPQGVIFQLADGTYTSGLHYGGGTFQTQSGNQGFIIKGNVSNPANVIIAPVSGGCIETFNNSFVSIQGLTLTALTPAGSAALLARTGSTIRNLGSIVFNTVAGNNHQTILEGAKIIHDGDYSISGSAENHVFCEQGAIYSCKSRTINYTADVTYGTQFAAAYRCSSQEWYGTTFATNGHTITGKRYDVADCSVIGTGGAGANYFPGNAPGTADAATFSTYN